MRLRTCNNRRRARELKQARSGRDVMFIRWRDLAPGSFVIPVNASFFRNLPA
jgi:hypothetical protein